jgi:hypothetical protein
MVGPDVIENFSSRQFEKFESARECPSWGQDSGPLRSSPYTIAGDKPGAEALSGLARAFFYAGARALLVSHWAVESNAAMRLTTSTFDIMKSDPIRAMPIPPIGHRSSWSGKEPRARQVAMQSLRCGNVRSGLKRDAALLGLMSAPTSCGHAATNAYRCLVPKRL